MSRAREQKQSAARGRLAVFSAFFPLESGERFVARDISKSSWMESFYSNASSCCALTDRKKPRKKPAKKTSIQFQKSAGMDFYVVLDRPGYRVAKRRQRQARVGIQHRLTKEDAMKWFQQKFDGVVLNKSSY